LTVAKILLPVGLKSFPFKPRVLKTSLSDEQAAVITAALPARTAAAPPR
jgi:hypothetical protein